ALTRRPPTPPLFPYTTLFRSCFKLLTGAHLLGKQHLPELPDIQLGDRTVLSELLNGDVILMFADILADRLPVGRQVSRFGELLRSEEHTSELQSRENLVCRLL